MTQPGHRCAETRLLSWCSLGWLLRVAAALSVAPALPLGLFWALVSLGAFAGAGSRTELLDLLGPTPVYAVTLACFPVTWLLSPIVVLSATRYGRLELRGYLLAGLAIAAGLSLLFPPAVLVALGAGVLVGFGIWCCLWLGRTVDDAAPRPKGDTVSDITLAR